MSSMSKFVDDKLEDGLNQRLFELATKIRTAANGRTCSGCKHHRDGWCATQQNYHGDNLAVLYPSAIACSKYEEKR
jgi:hypothetical protein